MRERFRLFFYLAIFWTVFMVICRILFLLYNHELTEDLTVKEVFLVLAYGLRMDLSISGYFLAFSGLLLFFSVFVRGQWISYAITSFTLLAFFVCSLIVTIDLELYRHWGFRLNTSPIFYVRHAGSEALGSVEPRVVLGLIAVLLVLLSAGAYVYKRWIAPRVNYLGPARAKASLVLLLLTALMIVPIRGSFSVAPMNTGFVYFHSSKPYANHAAINVVWNFLYSARKSASLKYPENFFDKTRAHIMVDSLYAPNRQTVSILNKKRPNILLIILESFTAGIVEPLGGLAGITPNLNALCREGILFDNFYSSGDRTDKGVVSILSGYPAQPQTSIIKFPAKSQNLPHLSKYLLKLGYQTSFVYGGDIDFANFRSYLNTGSFQHIVSIDDFEDEPGNAKWGIHDEFVFSRASAELDAAHAPFFKVVLTLTSHEPFDIPIPGKIKRNDEESMFLNSCHYTDKCLGDFIAHSKQQPWWENTLVVITADHGHRLPGNKQLSDKERFRIPLLMIGGAIEKKETVNHTISNQTDIANTLLAQVDRSSADFIFSKNIFAPGVIPFAAYFFNDGYGFLTPNAYIIYDNTGRQFLKQDGASAIDLDLSKAYQQRLFSDYNKR